MSINVSIGTRIRDLRNAHGMSQARLADALSARLGKAFDSSAMTRTEKGSRRLQADEAVLLAEIFEVPISSIFTEVNPREAILRDLAAKRAEQSRIGREIAYLEEELDALESA